MLICKADYLKGIYSSSDTLFLGDEVAGGGTPEASSPIIQELR